jgi:hypothetical protein
MSRKKMKLMSKGTEQIRGEIIGLGAMTNSVLQALKVELKPPVCRQG